ncbi:MAG: hypothetical protein D8H95_27260 [Lachnospiraceae bacterium]|nr:MAG: hypothetical protein D8H95_27260 [Lachnospiraceae bacterium]
MFDEYWLLTKSVLVILLVVYLEYLYRNYLKKEGANTNLAKFINKFSKIIILAIYIFTLND